MVRFELGFPCPLPPKAKKKRKAKKKKVEPFKAKESKIPDKHNGTRGFLKVDRPKPNSKIIFEISRGCWDVNDISLTKKQVVRLRDWLTKQLRRPHLGR